MAITAQDVMKLRKMTSAGMMDCKKALAEAEGDFEKAVNIIREKGKLVAAKRADRETSVRFSSASRAKRVLSYVSAARLTSFPPPLTSRLLPQRSLTRLSRHSLPTSKA